jgi:biotin transporter BioY
MYDAYRSNAKENVEEEMVYSIPPYVRKAMRRVWHERGINSQQYVQERWIADAVQDKINKDNAKKFKIRFHLFMVLTIIYGAGAAYLSGFVNQSTELRVAYIFASAAVFVYLIGVVWANGLSWSEALRKEIKEPY